MTIALELPVYGKQADFIDAPGFSAMCGGKGSGKTRAGAIKALAYCGKHPGVPGVVTAPTYDMLVLPGATIDTYRLVFKPLEIDYRSGDKVLTLKGGNEIYFRSTDDPDHLRGASIAWFHMDEGAQSPEAAYKELISRLRGYPDPTGWVTTTPRGYNWFYREFAKREGRTLIRVSTRDNSFLPSDYVHRLSEQYHDAEAMQEIEGQFVLLGGDCYFDVPSLQRLLPGKEGEVYKPYVVGRRYAAGVDPSGQGKDRHSLSILDCQTGEFVVDYTSSESVGEHSLKAVDLMGKYRQPLVVVEATGVGLAYLESLRRLGYPVSKLYQRPSRQLGYQERLLGTTPGPSLRDRILVDLAEGIRQGALIIYSARAIDECLSFRKQDKGHPEAAEGAQDDRVFAMAWAVFGSKQLPSLVSQGETRVMRYAHA